MLYSKRMDYLLSFENLTVFLISLLGATWLYWLWTRKDIYKFFHKSNVEWGLPILGIIGTHIRSVCDFLPCLKTLLEKGDYMICTFLGLTPVLFIADPQLIEKILKSPDLLNKASTIYTTLDYIIGTGLITSKADVWKEHRKAISPMFNYKSLFSFFSIFESIKRELIENFNALDDGRHHELFEIFLNASFETTMRTTEGKDFDEQFHNIKKRDIVKDFSYLLEATTMKAFFGFLKLGWIFHLNLKYYVLSERIRQLIKNIFNSKLISMNYQLTQCEKSSLDECDSLRKDKHFLADQAIQIIRKNKIDFQSIVIEANHIFVGAVETSANILFSFVALLAMHPDVQERLFEEIHSFYPDKDFNMEYQHMEQLPYLDMVINEVMRLTPAIPMIGRRVVKDTQLTEDITLPKNLDIFIPIVHLHRRKDIWGPEADKFNPDNFLPENIEGRHPYAFIPFSKGTRSCIGYRYAQFFIKIIAAGMVRNFKFSTDFKFEELVIVENIALKYKKYPEIRIERR